MAEKTTSLGYNGDKSESGAFSIIRVLGISSLNSHVDTNIPPYSVVTKVEAYTDAYQTIALGSTKTDLYMYFCSRDDGNVLGDIDRVYNGIEVVPKNSWTHFSVDITSKCITTGVNPGRINVSGAVSFSFYQTCTVVRTLKLRDSRIMWTYTTPTFVISLSAGTGGTVSGAGTYEVGSTATIKATPNAGYRFVKWNDGNTNAERQITITSSDISANVTKLSYTATFEKIKYDVVFKNYDGTVLQTSQVEHGSTPSYTGSTPTRASTAEYIYFFNGWSPSVGAVTAATTYTAQFTATKRSYTISASGSNGSVSGSGTYQYGSSVTLTAIPDNWYKFVKWSDGDTSNPRTVTVTGAATYTAIFEQMSRIILDENRAKGFLLDTNKVKGILIDDIKIY